jgi:hypothetical protein
MKIILATTDTLNHEVTLNKMDATNRLLSFYYVQNKRESFIEDYVNTGLSRYIDEDADRMAKMTDREFLHHFLSEYDLIDKEA